MANLKYFAQSMTPPSSSSVGARTCLSSSRDLIEWPACQRQSFHRSSGTSFQRGTSRPCRMLCSYPAAMTMLAPPTTSPFYAPAPGRSTTRRNRPNYVPAIRGGREKRPRFHRAPPGPPTYVGAENEASLYNDYCAQGPRSSSGRDCALPGTHEAPGSAMGIYTAPTFVPAPGSWSSGYDIALTQRRSPVRIRSSPSRTAVDLGAGLSEKSGP